MGNRHSSGRYPKKDRATVVRPIMVQCESHPDLHMASCNHCYSSSPIQRLKNLARARVPRFGWSPKGSSQFSVSASDPFPKLVSFRMSDADSAFTASSDHSLRDSLRSSGASSTQTNSSTGSSSSNKRWSRGRSEKRWPKEGEIRSLNSPTNDYKTAWPITLKEAHFLPEFPLKLTHNRFQNIEIVQQLSQGRFSSVWKVRATDTGEEFALKQMSKENIIRTRAIKQVKMESQIQKACCHPFLVSALATWQNRRHLFIVSEYVTGGDLSDVASDFGPFPEAVVQIWGAEIAIGLDHLHHLGIIYRDLSLNNILIDQEGHVKITDFGLSRFTNENSPRAMTICGTLDFMAPEVLKGEPYDFASDWWSFGIVLYVLLLGEFPLEAEKNHFLMAEKVMKHVYLGSEGRSANLERRLSPAAIILLRRLLKKAPQERLSDFQLIRRQAFFCSLNFAQVYRKIVPPFALKNFAAVVMHLKAAPGSRVVYV